MREGIGDGHRWQPRVVDGGQCAPSAHTKAIGNVRGALIFLVPLFPAVPGGWGDEELAARMQPHPAQMCLTRTLRRAHKVGMKLASWISRTGITPAEAARRFRVAHTTVGRWCSGGLFPGLDNLLVIREVTGGAVTADDFMPPVTAPSAEPSAAAEGEAA